MGRWLALAAGTAWLVALATWLITGSPRGSGAEVQAQLWEGGSARAPSLGPGIGRPCVAIERMDRLSSTTACLTCHDGTVGPSDVRFDPSHAQGSSHPVDVIYAAAYAEKPGEYVPPGALPYGVVLVEGKVACTSCHDPDSPEPSHVAQPNSLCTACHVK